MACSDINAALKHRPDYAGHLEGLRKSVIDFVEELNIKLDLEGSTVQSPQRPSTCTSAHPSACIIARISRRLRAAMLRLLTDVPQVCQNLYCGRLYLQKHEA